MPWAMKTDRAAPLTFTDLLRLSSLDPATVRLVRHQKAAPNGETPWSLWKAQDGRFEAYQRIQRPGAFGNARYIAAFAGLPGPKTIFLGLYEVAGQTAGTAPVRCPLMGTEIIDYERYELTPHPTLSGYIGRLLVDWGEGYRSWIQRADGPPKPVTEIRAGEPDPPFPGWLRFETRLSQLTTLPAAWLEILQANRGVYLLRETLTGALYVGAALGANGFLGRWRDYAANGHGGNVKLIARPESDYVMSVLETAASSASDQDVLDSEAIWKAKLGTRSFGLNGN